MSFSSYIWTREGKDVNEPLRKSKSALELVSLFFIRRKLFSLYFDFFFKVYLNKCNCYGLSITTARKVIEFFESLYPRSEKCSCGDYVKVDSVLILISGTILIIVRK